uniref:Alternative oxidase n=1 Tax=Mucochytrium quahogii TaxID=96639 RepID=A0A7S2W613_9STRA|mmetsp:Transcript_27650/g.44206  ORF Transcript_27650/g.44206 Transcript_27650/m.44206 type:complete len:294 (+) Transcript_27650:56-937(+)|eukprot:CAMPEP_0203756762 /NCGR_PEP_ID=MMETSP0098-20131031/9966_1 /ASSEMBLY_ACC=CAM_ASM_000208 /TAXON_ID=96639 /ORGANISM=" , Strain NY0313808BC1" /LENGTH=293 /DNA_ID=CAMNT_0050648747 /DNA_START=48 /DNA_END=929 /DNA_ORIENTATION=+
MASRVSLVAIKNGLSGGVNLFPARTLVRSRGLATIATRRNYDWISTEAEELIAKAYCRHQSLASQGSTETFPPSLSVKDLEAIGAPVHFPPQSVGDEVAIRVVKVLEKFMHLFFREKYDHHAVTLETVAAVPGIVAAAHRHLRSLRNMKRDHGWIVPLQEEAENERMHLLIMMQHCKPSLIERVFVIGAQGLYVLGYGIMYATSPKTAHRVVGYLEEAAHRAYTDYLQAIDKGEIENVNAQKIAISYYHLPQDAKLRDVVLQIRADEAMHRDFNHHLSNLYRDGKQDQSPASL